MLTSGGEETEGRQKVLASPPIPSCRKESHFPPLCPRQAAMSHVCVLPAEAEWAAAKPQVLQFSVITNA